MRKWSISVAPIVLVVFGSSFSTQVQEKKPVLFKSIRDVSSSLQRLPGGEVPLTAQSSTDQCIAIDFEGPANGLPFGEVIPGVTFGPNWIACIDEDTGAGTCNIANEPSPSTVAVLIDLSNPNDIKPLSEIVAFDSPVSAVSFFYASLVPVTIDAFDSTGNLVGTESGPATPTDTVGGDPTGAADLWFSLVLDVGSDDINMVTITGFNDFTAIDDFIFCSTPLFIPPIEPWVQIGFGWADDWQVKECFTTPRCDPPRGRRRFRHAGFDAQANVGKGVRASADGEVVFAPKNIGGGFGGAVVLEHDLDGNPSTTEDKVTTLYLHVDPLVTEGAVKQGDVIAAVARIRDPHLHFGFRRAPFDPSNPSASLRGALPPEGTSRCRPCFSRPAQLPAFPEQWEDPQTLINQ